MKEKADTAILRCVNEFRVLFPDRKITTNTIVDWCGGVGSGKTVRRILVRNYEKKGGGKLHIIKEGKYRRRGLR